MEKCFEVNCNLKRSKLVIRLVSIFIVSTISNIFGQTVVNLTNTNIWSLPAGVTAVQVELWGGGGGGGGRTTNGRGGGGGGGAYSRSLFTGLAPGSTFNYSAGVAGTGSSTLTGAGSLASAGGTSTFSTSTGTAITAFSAGGGAGVAINSNAGVGGGTAANGNQANRVGGNGASESSYVFGLTFYRSGGGGGGAGTNNPGQNGNNNAGGAGGTVGGGAGGAGRDNSNGVGGVATAIGGGGGGAFRSSGTQAGGNGAAGLVRITYCLNPTIGALPAAGCAGAVITLSGTNFISGSTTVSFNGVSSPAVNVTSSTSLTAQIPASATTGPILISTLFGATSAPSANYTVTAVPSVPTGIISNTASPACPSTGVTFSNATTPPSGITWYWQSANNGSSTVLGNSGTDLTLMTSGAATRWLQAQDNASFCWSTASLASNAIMISTPSLVIDATGTPAAGNLSTSTNNVVLSGFRLSPVCVTYDVSSVTYTTGGTATTSDLSNFRIVYDADNSGTFNGGDAVVSGAGIALAGSLFFTITHTGQTGANRYLLVADIAAGAVPGRTFSGSITAATNVTVSTSPSVTLSGTATGNLQTIRPINDICNGAITLTPGAAPVNGSTIGAIRDAQALAGCNYNCGAGIVDVWYQFTASCTATYTVTVNGAGDNTIGVYSGSCGSLSYIGCNGTGGANVQKTFNINATAGTTYYVSVWNTATTTFGFCNTPAATSNFTIGLSDPIGVVLSNLGTPAIGGILQGSIAILSGFQLAPSCITNYGLTSVNYTVTGTATSADLSNFRIIYDANSNGVFDGGESSVSGAGTAYAATLSFTVSHPTQTGTNRYLLVANVSNTATVGNTFVGSITSVTNAPVTINPSGNYTGSATGNTQTIRPINDICNGAITLTPGAAPVNGSTIGAIRDAQALAGCNYNCGAGIVDVWYQFTASCTATYTVTVNGAGDNTIGVYSGSCGSLSYIGCNGTGGANVQKTFNINATAGTTYYVSIWNTATTTFGFCNTPAAISNFTIALNNPVGVALSNAGTPAAGRIFPNSTVVLSGFQLAPICITDYSLTSVNYTVTGTATSSDLSNFRIIYDANSNGVFDGGESSVSGAGTAYAATLSFTVSHPTQAATNRYLLVADVSNSATLGNTFVGSITSAASAAVTINPSGNCIGNATGNTQTIRPINDICSGSITLVPGATAISGTTITATRDAQASAGCNYNNGSASDLWYQFTATCNATYTVTIAGATNYNTIGVYSGSCGSLSYITCNATGGVGVSKSINITASAGTTYFISVWNTTTYNAFFGIYSTQGASDFNISLSSPAPIINAMSANICSGSNFTLTPVNATNGFVPVSTTYTWSAPVVSGITGTTSGSGASNISGTLTNTTSASINVLYTVTPTAPTGPCAGASFIVTVTVNPTAVPASVATATGATLTIGDLLWSGNSSTAWGSNMNWVAYDGTNFVVPGGGVAPGVNDRVFILPSSTSGICISAINSTTVTATGSAKDVFIGSGATMLIDAGQNLQVNGDWTNNGTFTPNATATVEFTGGVDQVIGGSSANNFTNLTLNKSANTLILNTPLTVSRTLTMTAGNIATSVSNLLTVGTSPASPGIVDWTGGTVVGPLQRYFSATANGTQASGIFPVGLSDLNRFAQVNYTGGLSTGGTITAEYKVDACPVGYAGLPNTINGQMIQNYENEGYWEITPSGGNLNAATYSLILRGNALSTVTSVPDMAKLRIIKSSGPAHTSWDNGGIGSHSAPLGGVSDFTISNSGMTGFSFFNIGSGNANPLPVTMLDFAANCNEKSQVELNWTTASEQNSQNFLIERSRDLTQWEHINSINAAGNSNFNIDYATLDTDSFSGVSYYRLMQVDINGDETIYGPISVSCSDVTNSMIVFPNPTKGNFTVEITTDEDLGDSQLVITDLSGKVISSRNIYVLQGISQAIFEHQELKLGTYIIQLNSSNHNIKPIRIVVN